MRLYDAWKRIAYDPQGKPVNHVWEDYLALEKVIYENILRDQCTHIEGTVSELGERFNISATYVCAFLDGIHEAVDGLPPVDEVEEDTAIILDIDFKRLYKQMVEYKAEPLYTLPQWNDIFPPDVQKQYYTEQKKAHTIVRNTAKIGRNDPCPCGSGKKYKKCCGAV